ncbi:MAG: leucine-rich repeat domain-containing protein [Candidatus Thorarchaeota archaeon]
MDRVILRYRTSNGLERTVNIDTSEARLSLELRDIESIDLMPLVWCTELETLNLQYNKIRELDLTPLAKCAALQEVNLSHNDLREIDLTPLSSCHNLRELRIDKNRIRRVDVSPLFECPKLEIFRRDDFVSLTASIFLRSIGSWPNVLMDEYHRILWTHGESSARPSRS